MKKIAILILSVSVSISTMAQKKELKVVEKLIKSGDFSEAAENLNGLENLVIDTKYESYYYFLEGKAAYGDNKTNDYVKAANYFYKTLEVEKRIGEKDYSEKAVNYINTIRNDYYKIINKSLKNEDFKKTGDAYEVLWNISPQRKDLLENVLYARIKTKNYTESAVILEKLLKSLGDTIYGAVNKETSKINEFFTRKARDREVSLEINFGPVNTVLEKKVKLEYYTNLIGIYNQQKNFERELVKLKEAKKEYPKHVPFFENYAAAIYRTGDKEAYIVALKEALELEPKKIDLWYNLGVVSQDINKSETALMAYDKVLELDPMYRNAYINKALAILSAEKSLIDELNKSAGTKNYAVVKKKITDMYVEAIPLLEKAYSIKKDDEVKRNLIGLYKAVGETSKAKALE